jgi:hypothetical protein
VFGAKAAVNSRKVDAKLDGDENSPVGDEQATRPSFFAAASTRRHPKRFQKGFQNRDGFKTQ